MKRKFVMKKVFLLVVLASVSLAYGFAGGDGSAQNPYQIATKADLEDVCDVLSACYILVNDINLSDTVYHGAVIAPNIGTTSSFEGSMFNGTFDGNGYVIRNLTIDGDANSTIGLFGRVGYAANSSNTRIPCIKNLGIENVNIIDANVNAGALAGYVGEDTIVTNCYATGSVTGQRYIGGLVGTCYRSRIDGCHAAVTVVSTGDEYAGGLVAWNTESLITNSYATGSVAGCERVGGLVGNNNIAATVDSYATGNVTSTSTASRAAVHTGGLVGNNSASSAVISCYATGNVTGIQRVGGLVGNNLESSCLNSYAAGSVTVSGSTSQDAGGFIGRHANGSVIQNCYATGAVTGDSSTINIGGFAGRLMGTYSTESSITDSYAAGTVSGGSQYIGGFFGQSESRIEDCYSVGHIDNNTAPYAGGFGGANWGTVDDCLYDKDTSGMTASSGGEGKTTAEMKTVSTYTDAGWDIYSAGTEDDWYIVDGNYPMVYRLSGIYVIPFSGSGTSGDPYQISTLAELKEINHHPTKSYILMNNLDMTGVSLTRAVIAPHLSPLASKFVGAPFMGVFDGNDCVVQNLTIMGEEKFLGLFGKISFGAAVKNLGVVNADIGSSGAFSGNCKRVGGFAGAICSPGTVVENCYATGDIYSGTQNGGFVGEVIGGNITNCYADVDINVGGSNGGFVGEASEYCHINNCYATGSVTGRQIGTTVPTRLGGFAGDMDNVFIDGCYATGNVISGQYAGGFVGYLEGNSHITNSYAAGDTTSNIGTSRQRIGGFVGSWENTDGSSIEGCYATGDSLGKLAVGGFVGSNSEGTVINCYALGSATGNTTDADRNNWGARVGGMAGANYNFTTYTNCYAAVDLSATLTTALGGFIGFQEVVEATVRDINDCFWDTDVSGETDGIGGSGTSGSGVFDPLPDPELIGLTTTQMKTRSNFVDAGWDYAAIWAQCADSYPILRWQDIYELLDMLADLNGDCIVNMFDLNILAGNWLQTGQGVTGDIVDDNIVNFADFAKLAEEWLE